jgi:hypothetical protein
MKVSSNMADDIIINAHLSTGNGMPLHAGVLALSPALLKENEGGKVKVNVKKSVDRTA